jgi:glycosyltransferase involved in cell wall biosynthesis
MKKLLERMPKKILFFIEGLKGGGKERRFLELIQYLKSNTSINMKIVLTNEDIHYNYVHNIGIPIIILKRRWFKKDPFLFFRFYKIAREFKPDIIHTWGGMTTFYAIPSRIFLKRPLLSNLISDAKIDRGFCSLWKLYFKINCFFTDLIISNSKAGISAYKANDYEKKEIIYNGVSLERFKLSISKKKIKNEIHVYTRFMVIMVAQMSWRKDFDLFLDVARIVNQARDDVTFVGVGGGPNYEKLQLRRKKENLSNVIITGIRHDVEELIAVSDIGVLFSSFGEGISNSIIEYMASGKPVITTDTIGGSREIIADTESGFIMDCNPACIAEKINQLLDNDTMRVSMGEKGREIIESRFTIDRMGKDFLKVYNKYN